MVSGRSRGRDIDRALVDAEYLVVWAVALLVIAGVAGAVVTYGDEVRDATPDTAFVVSFDEDTRTLTVAHNGGDPITDRHTQRLSVVIADANGSTTERIAWAGDDIGIADRGSGYPVREGESIAIDDPSVDADGDGNYHDADATVGFHLDADDAVRVEWTGTRRGGKTTTLTLVNATLVRSDTGTVRYGLDG